jgi:hypothetical protein
MHGAAAYLQDAPRVSSEEDEEDEFGAVEVRRYVGDAERVGSGFAALEVGDDENESASDDDETSWSSSCDSSEHESDETDLTFPDTATVDDILALVSATDDHGAVVYNRDQVGANPGRETEEKSFADERREAAFEEATHE